MQGEEGSREVEVVEGSSGGGAGEGARLLAESIRSIAVEHDVPIVQKPDLARQLFRTVDAGQAIPEPLFRAVAEVLAYVYQIDRRIEKIREREGGWRAAPQAG